MNSIPKKWEFLFFFVQLTLFVNTVSSTKEDGSITTVEKNAYLQMKNLNFRDNSFN